MESVLSEDNTSRRALVLTTREQELQKLLAEERVRSEQRKSNYSTLKAEHLKLQKDFLSLQTEMRQILEETKFIKDKKDIEVDNVMKFIEEKERTIEKLTADLRERDPLVIKESFAQELQEPMKKLQKEKDMMARDKERLGFELKMTKQKVEYLEKESIDSIERTKLAFEAEINLIRKEKEELRVKLMEANQLPDAQKLSHLAQENAKLNAKISGFHTTLEEAEVQYRKIEGKVESLLMDQEKHDNEYEKQISALNNQLISLREENRNLREVINTNSREKDELKFEIKRLQNEICRNKKEIEEKEKYFTTEKEKIKHISMKGVKECEDQRNSLSEQLKKLKLEIEAKDEVLTRIEQENKLKDKECHLQIISIKQQEFEKQCNIEQEKNTLQSQLKYTVEERNKLKEEIEQMRRQIENSAELRMGVERDLMIARAKLESYQLDIDELEKLRRQHMSLHDELSKLRSESLQQTAMNKELIRQRDQFRDDYYRIKETLDEERKHLEDFRVQSDKNLAKLKHCIEEERYEMREKLLALERDVIKCKKDRDEAKAKYKQFAAISERLQSKLSDMKDHHKYSPETQRTKQSSANVSADVHNQLKKEFKTLKKRQNELSSLLNCSFDSTKCKLTDAKDDEK